MFWQRLVLGIAILAMTLALLVPLPMWLTVTCISVALVAALTVIARLVLGRDRH